jgi:hypothetical protein
MAALDHRVQHDLVMHRVQRVDHPRRIRKVLWVPGELTVPRIPARWRELGSKIDQRVAGQLFLAERACDAKHFLRAAKRAVRLHVPERPPRRQFGEAGDGRVLAHDRCRLIRRHDEHVEGQQASHVEAPFGPGEIERAEWPMDVEPPSIRANYPLDRDAPAVRAQSIPLLAVPHLVDRALAIELRSALAETEKRPAAEQKRQRASLRIGSQLLNDLRAREHADVESARDFHLEMRGFSFFRLADL